MKPQMDALMCALTVENVDLRARDGRRCGFPDQDTKHWDDAGTLRPPFPGLWRVAGPQGVVPP